MFKIGILLFAALWIGTGTLQAQEEKPEVKTEKLSWKEQRKAAREARKAEREAQKQAEIEEGKRLFEEAVAAVANRDFVLEAEKIEFRSGQFVYVTESTNFVALHDQEATIQLSFNIPVAGPNGMGGITVDGTISEIKERKDKKGNMTYEMMVQGVAVSANVIIRLTEGTNDCRVTVVPNFHSNRISFVGHLYPTEQANVFKGRSI